jgi:hypothetical protein
MRFQGLDLAGWLAGWLAASASRWQLLPLASHAGEFRSKQAPDGQLLATHITCNRQSSPSEQLINPLFCKHCDRSGKIIPD